MDDCSPFPTVVGSRRHDQPASGRGGKGGGGSTHSMYSYIHFAGCHKVKFSQRLSWWAVTQLRPHRTPLTADASKLTESICIQDSSTVPARAGSPGGSLLPRLAGESCASPRVVQTRVLEHNAYIRCCPSGQPAQQRLPSKAAGGAPNARTWPQGLGQLPLCRPGHARQPFSAPCTARCQTAASTE